MMEIKLAVFDMAGTTVNEDNVVYKTVRQALVDSGVEVSLERVLEIAAGKEKYQAIVDVLEHTGAKDPKAEGLSVFKDFQQKLKEAYTNLEVSPYPGVEALFELLGSKGVKVVLNTGYDKKTAQTLLEKLQWSPGRQIDALITADDVVMGRPFPEMIHKAMALYGIKDPGSVLKAGDSVIDIEEGKNAHCGMTVGVLSGAQTREQLETAEPTLILDSLQELGDILFPGQMKK